MRNFSIYLIFISCLCISFLYAHKDLCSDPRNWCKSESIARKCEVYKQCQQYVWSYKNSNEEKSKASYLVDVGVYYETLCPDSRKFITDQLWDAFNSVGSIMNITLVPYGNANETYRSETKLWQFSCQHGPNECWGNLFQTCFIHYYPKSDSNLEFIRCVESNTKDTIRVATLKCSQQFNLTLNDINTCMNSRLGNNLQHQQALLTRALNPPHTFVPWITINGAASPDIEDQALVNLIPLVCNAYKGPSKPSACQNDIF